MTPVRLPLSTVRISPPVDPRGLGPASSTATVPVTVERPARPDRGLTVRSGCGVRAITERYG